MAAALAIDFKVIVEETTFKFDGTPRWISAMLMGNLNCDTDSDFAIAFA